MRAFRKLHSSGLALLLRTTHLWIPAAILIACTAGMLAEARVGGGQSYSGGSSRSSRGSYGGGSSSSSGSLSADDIYFLIEILYRLARGLVYLTLHHPVIGIPLDLLILVGIWYVFRSASDSEIQIQGTARALSEQAWKNNRNVAVKARLDQLKTIDPNFSRVLFMDFAHALYSHVQHARGQRKLDNLSFYLSPGALERLAGLAPALKSIEGVVIGSMSISEVGPISAEKPTQLWLEIESNYTETSVTGQSQSWYSRETWKLSRQPGVRSKAPDRIRQISCPACGAPPAANSQGLCPACGNRIRSGDFDWFVESVDIRREAKPPLLTSDVPEEGTDLPTLVDPGFAAARERLRSEDPSFDWNRFLDRASFIFLQLQKAWTERKWETVRPYESDNVFESHSYWMTQYKKQKLVNVLKDVRIEKIAPVKIAQDRYFTAITLRIHAKMIDFTQTEEGKIVSGSPRKHREFSEYWTFIRGRSAKPRPAGSKDPELTCPSCGAGLKINRSGHCEYCRAKITSGDFDWVLSTIEQDEAYAG